MKTEIRQVRELPVSALAPLISECEASGFHILTKLRDDWLSGENSFDQPGEALFIAEVDGQVIGACGVNRNPHDLASHTGRVRRLFVAREHRRKGVATSLVSRVMEVAAGHFDELEVYTSSEEAKAFYVSLGYRPVTRPHASHVIELRSECTTTGST